MPGSSSRATGIAVRRASPADGGRVAEIYNHAIAERLATFETEPRTEAAMETWISDHGERYPVLVATDAAGVVVAWASLSEYRPRACYAGIGEFSVYVAAEHRGRGIGTLVLEALIQEAARLGYWKLVSRVFTFNAASRELCRRCGFREVGIYESHGKLDGKWLDTVIVERLIPENLA